MDGGGARRILVVEDDRDVAGALSGVLGLWGNEVRTAGSGPEALEIAREWPPDAAVVDIGLPIMDGCELAVRLRRELGAGVLLVALTGWDGDEDRACSREAGFDRHLVKPVDIAVLKEAVTAIAAAGERREAREDA